MTTMTATIRSAVILVAAMTAASAARAQDTGWFVTFESESVSQIPRSDTGRFVEVGTIQTDGFTEMRISLGGEFKGTVPKVGEVGAILIPDMQPFPYLLENEGRIVFSIEAKVAVHGQVGPLFYSPTVVAKVAFPAYRVYLYNDTSSVANVSVYVYRARL